MVRPPGLEPGTQ